MNETTFDPSAVKSQIEAFEAAGMQVYNYVKDANVEFVNAIAENWFSARAVEFATKNLPQMYKAQNDLLVFVNNHVIMLVNAYNAYANANNVSTLSTDRTEMAAGSLPTDTPADFAADDGSPKIKEINGDKVGMYVDNVKTAISNLTNKIRGVIDVYLDRIPREISINDPNGDIQTSFRTGIDTAKANFETELESIYDSINSVIEYEVALTESAETAATESISGTPTV